MFRISMRHLTPTLALALALSGSAIAAEKFRQLKGQDIKSRFGGMEFTDEVHWADVFERDGTITSFSIGRKNTGAWRVEANELCLTRARDERHCYQVWASGNRVQLRQPGIEIYDEGILQKPQNRR